MKADSTNMMPHAKVTRTLLARRKPLWRRVFTENLGAKLVSIGLAVALFVLVREDKGKEADIDVSVVLSNFPESQVFVGELPKVMRVRVRDRWSRLARALERKANPYMLDLRGFADGAVFVFERERIGQLIGVSSSSIQSVYPSEMLIRMEQKIERVVPVRVTFVGDVQEGYEVQKDQVRVIPKEIKIFGARSSVKEVIELATYPVDLVSLDKDARLEVPIQKPALPFLGLDDERVRVEVTVRTKNGDKNVGDVRVAVRNCPEDMTCAVEPPIASVKLEGPLPVLLKLKKPDLLNMVYVDAGDLDASVAVHDAVKPTCDRPQNVRCVIKPGTVTLKFLSVDEREMKGGGHKPR